MDARADAPVLTEADVAAFERDGLVRVPGAFPRDVATALADEVWEELRAEHGIEREDRATWFQPPRAPRRAKRSPTNRGLAAPRLLGAIRTLVGASTWSPPRDWGGFLVTFPEPPGTAWDVPADTWHWDGDPASRGLFLFTFYSAVRSGGGGTPVVVGSHRLLRRFYAALTEAERDLPHKVHRRMFSTWHPWLAELTGRREGPRPRAERFLARATDVHGVPCRVVELTGEPGDAVLCSRGILHAIARNHADAPRIMRSKMLHLPEDWARFRAEAERGVARPLGP